MRRAALVVAACVLTPLANATMAPANALRDEKPRLPVHRPTGARVAMLADLNPGAASSRPRGLHRASGSLYFSAVTPGLGTEPWVSDGTAATTRLIGDFVRGRVGSFLRDVAPTARGTVFTLDNRDAAGDGPWTGSTWLTTTTGAASGETSLLQSGPDISTGAARFGDDAMVFVSDFTTDNAKMLRTDGTPGGTRVVKDGLTLGESLVPAGNGKAFFLDAQNPLMITDGTTAGTHRVYGWRDGPTGSALVMDLSALDGRAYLQVDDQYKIGAELWFSTGTHDGTRLVKDIYPGPGSSWPHRLRPWNGQMYLIARDGRHGPEVWRSDSTESGTVRVTDVAASARNLIACQNKLYFTTANDRRVTLWATDGRRGHERRVAKLPGTRKAGPGNLNCLPGGLVFTAADGIHGREVWTLAAGTHTPVLHDVRPGPKSSRPHSLTRAGSTVYLVAQDGVHGQEVWTVRF